MAGTPDASIGGQNSSNKGASTERNQVFAKDPVTKL